MSSPSLTLPSQERPAARRRLLEILGALAIAATYVYLVLNQPADITGGPGSASALIALTGVLAGPAAGAATGALSSIVWSFFNPTVLPFAAGAALIGCLAGLAARYGLFRRFYLAPVAGFITGIIAGVVSAPVAAFVFGGTSGVATGAIVSAFRAMGDTLLAAITKQALISDPMDKAIVFTIVAILVYALPRRTRQQFPFSRRHRVLAGTNPASTPEGTRVDASAPAPAHGNGSGPANDSSLNG